MMSGRPFSARRHRAVGLELLVLGRRRRALEEEELRSQQADAFGARVHGERGLGGLADVRDDLDAVAVGHDGRLVAGIVLLLALPPPVLLERERRRQLRRARLGVQRPRRAVEDADDATREVEHGGTGAHHGRDVEGAGDDGRVGRRPAADGAEPEDALRIEPRRVAGREVVGDEDHGDLRQPDLAVLGSGKDAQDPLTHVVQVGGAAGQALVAHLALLGHARVEDLLPRPRGPVAERDQRLGFRHQLLIIQERPGGRGRWPPRSCRPAPSPSRRHPAAAGEPSARASASLRRSLAGSAGASLTTTCADMK